MLTNGITCLGLELNEFEDNHQDMIFCEILNMEPI